MTCLYNEIDAYPAAWLRNLIDGGHVAPGTVDERSIVDLGPQDVEGRPFHAFAGIGVWSYALRLAGVPDSAPVWTGSCPCQPFSVAGRRRGADDERHLWPAWFRLIRECRPPVVFGEQVGGASGRAWLAAVRVDLESAGYAVGAADLPAAGCGAPHVRNRIFFVANTRGEDVARPVGKWCGVRSKQSETSTIDSYGGLPAWPDKQTDSIPSVSPDGPARCVGVVRACGNAIVAPLAAAFIVSAMMALGRPPSAPAGETLALDPHE